MSSASILPLAPDRNRHLPQQERSRATRDRILSALALLLEHKRFDAITTAELTRAAQCSMSSLYARFPTKLSFFVRSYREHRGLLRSLVQHDRKQATSAFATRTRAYKHMVMQRALAVVLKGERRTARPKVVRAFGFTLWLVVLAIENIVLFDALAGSEHVSDEKLTEELTAVFVGRIELAEERA
jgi:AcrR family transcriptional regulator